MTIGAGLNQPEVCSNLVVMYSNMAVPVAETSYKQHVVCSNVLQRYDPIIMWWVV